MDIRLIKKGVKKGLKNPAICGMILGVFLFISIVLVVYFENLS